MVGMAHAKLCRVEKLSPRLCPPYGYGSKQNPATGCAGGGVFQNSISRCVPCYFNLSWTFASADSAHSSSKLPPGAPLTPIPPIAAPFALMVTPPTP